MFNRKRPNEPEEMPITDVDNSMTKQRRTGDDISFKSRNNPVLTTKTEVWLVIASLMINFFSFGFGFCLSVLYPEFVRVFDSSRSSAAMVQSLFTSLSISGGILWNPVVVKYGPGKSIIFGALLTFSGLFISVFSVNIWMLVVFIGILAGLFNSIIVLAPFLLLNKIRDRWKNAALSVVSIGGSFGQFVFPYIIEISIEYYSWRGALLVMSGIMANLIPCGLLFYKIERSIKTSELVGTSKLFDTVVFRQWRYHVLLVCLFLFAFSGFVESRFLVDEMLVKGFERQTGSEFMSYIGLMNFCGRIVGFVSKLIIPGKGILQMSLFTLINGGSHAIIIFSGSYYGILFGALLNGFSYGLCVTQIPVLMLEIFPDKLYGPAISVMNLVGGIGSILVGYFGGFIFDVTNNYTILFDIAAAFSVLIASLLLIVGLSLTASTIKQSEYTKL